MISELIAGKYVKSIRLDEKLRYLEGKTGHYQQIDIGCSDQDLGWGFKPRARGTVLTSDFETAYIINSNGIRDKEYYPRNISNRFKIVALGESNVFGQGIDYGKRFTERIEQKLNNAEIINMAIWGFGIDQSFLQLKKDGFRYKPDLVILFIIEDSLNRCGDFLSAIEYKPRFILSSDKTKLILQDTDFLKSRFGDRFVSKSNNSSEQANKRFSFIKKSKLLTLINYYKKRKMINEKLEERDRIYWKNVLDEFYKRRRILQDYSKEDLRKIIFILLKEYKKLCDAHKINFLAVNIDACKIPYLTDFCYDLGIPYLDLYDILIRASNHNPLRFDIDPHYNEFAHRIIGEQVSMYIKDRYDLEKKKENINGSSDCCD